MLDDYDPTSGAMRGYLSARHGAQPGDPRLLGAAVCALVQLPQPPLRLALGPDALQQVRDKAALVTSESQRWERLSLSTSFSA